MARTLAIGTEASDKGSSSKKLQPTFGDVFFFQNPRDAKDLHSVKDEKMRQVMLARGYVEVYPTRAQGF